MKKALMIFMGILLMGTSMSAQEYKKPMKNAKKALAKYVKDTENNAAELTNAMSFLDEAMAIDGNAAALYNLKGEINGTLADMEIRKTLLDPTYALQSPEAALSSFEAYSKGLELAGDDKKAKKVAVTGLESVQRHLDNIAITHYNLQDYASSFNNFSSVLKAHELIAANGGKSFLADEAAVNEKTFSTAVTGYYGEKLTEATPYFKSLYTSGSEEPLVYEALYKITSDAKYLEEGRVKFPADKGLMFALINEKIQSGDMAGAKSALDSAIEADPENVSVYVTAGSVSERTGDMESAKKYYEQALTVDETNFDATYSIGAMYYNQAAGMTEELNALANDYSKAGTAKYDAAKVKMDGLFDQALPFFAKAEGLNGADVNTLIALKEIYARKNQLDKAEAYKAKIEALK